MRTDTYKLANVAYAGRYVSLVNGNIVGHSEEPGIMIEWFPMFHEGGLATFQAVRNDEVCDEYIYFDTNTRSLTCSDNPWLFLVREGNTTSSSICFSTTTSLNWLPFSIEIEGTDDWAWTLTSPDENSPIKTQRNTGASTEQLWKFEKLI
ncbi:hypothetical protein CY34DRAFT_774497 [Suillus luteus UH-Slu-Lm8-n1]|uniref:Ricin B lectin domain-containing protein n=1 Tax=Suillus luteus UH-Slu-Lm8-n1 TaxID=930992 RepID=A0A0D0C2E8_9AGAM|nr:hypothetical protein CY34DRAFT_774497 [Suillus luteus UH-Slu-Lm8-n1]